MTIYERFCGSSLDTAAIGLATEPEAAGHPFTPLGAHIIGWTGRDYVHFCFVEGFGETVFAVDPAAGEPVYPVANTFSEFLGLILACRGTEAILNAWCCSSLRFSRFLAQQRLSYKQQSILRAIANAYAPPAIVSPFSYLMEIRRSFDGRRLAFSPEAAEAGLPLPYKFTAAFSGSFWEPSGKKKAGKETRLNQTVSWGDQLWHIPALYACKEGLVLDFCVEVPFQQLQAFSEKYPDAEYGKADAAVREYPLNIEATAALTLNGKRLPEKSGCRIVWDPLLHNDGMAARLMEHYSCDREAGWVFLRKAFLWYRKRQPAIQSLKLTLQAPPVTIPGQRFQTPPVGESLTLRHPVSGGEYTLTVQEFTQEELDANFLLDYPKHYAQMRYTLSPALPEAEFFLRDCVENDATLEPIMANAQIPEAASIGIIGGSDGPTAIYLSRPAGLPEDTRVACSAFHYTPPEAITWQAEFREKPRQDLSIDLLQGGAV